MNKKLLVVVDMQRDFLEGALGTREAQALLPRVRERIEGAKAAGETVVFTRDTHDYDYLQTQEGKKLPVPHCIRGTEGWGIDPFLPSEGCRVFDKPTFGSRALAAYAAEEGFAAVELIGVCTDICVLSNAVLLKAALPEAQLVVDARCVASNDDKANEEALDMLQSVQVEVVGR